MNKRWFALMLIPVLAGYGCRREPAEAIGEDPSVGHGATSRQAPLDEAPNVVTYNTGDVDVWPSIDAPSMVITFEPPEVPEHLKGPFPEKAIPAAEE